MQVTNSQPAFRGTKYSLNHHTDIPAITDRLKAETDKIGEKYDVHVKLKGAIKCIGGDHHCDNITTNSKVVVSKANKTPLEKVLHFFGLMPKATASSKFDHSGEISTPWATAQALGDTKKAVKKFEGKA